MSDLNTVILIGNLTRDSELKYTSGGTPVLNASIAVNRSIPPKDGGEWENVASFFDFQVWGKLAESKHPSLTKGKRVAIHGEMRQDRWEQDGQNRSKVYVVVDKIQPLSDSRKDKPDVQQPESPPARPPAAQPAKDSGLFKGDAPQDDFTDDIPF